MQKTLLIGALLCLSLLFSSFLSAAFGTSPSQSDSKLCKKEISAFSPAIKPRPVMPPPHIDDAKFPSLDWKKHVYWPLPTGRGIPYRLWSKSKRDRLNIFFQAFATGSKTPSMNCPDPAVSLYYMTASQAQDIYLAHVAHALALEYTRKLSWRLCQLPQEELVEILGPGSLIAPIPPGNTSIQYPTGMRPGQGYRLPFRQSQAAAFVCDPQVGYRFMNGRWPGQPKNLLGDSEEETLKNLTAWFRDEVSHGLFDEVVLRRHALLKDRLIRYQEPTITKTSYWATRGCQSAVNTMADLARSVNIPLLRVGSSESGNGNAIDSHGALLFRWARKKPLVLVHVDDIYSQKEDWIVFPTTGTVQATPQEKDWQFFRANWVSPQELERFGFRYTLARVPAQTPPSSCISSMWCDLFDYGWHIGGWQKGTRENPDQSTAQQLWLDYFSTIKDRIMSDGKPCWDDQAYAWHPECFAEVSLASSKIRGTYYAGELNKGYLLWKSSRLGAYTFLRNICDFPDGNFNWEAYIDDEQGQPSPLNYGWQYYRDRAQEVVNTYGGCQYITSGFLNTLNHKFRP